MLESPVSILLAIIAVCLGWLLRNIRLPKWLVVGVLCGEIVTVALMGSFAWEWLEVPLVVFSVPMMEVCFAVCFRQFKVGKGGFETRQASSLLVHGGLAVVFCAAMCGQADVERGQMILYEGKPEMQAYANDGGIMGVPFVVELERFEIDYYPGGAMPKMYRSRLNVNGEHLVTEVNSPAHYSGYALFQAGYDAVNNEYAVIEVVKDPWLPVVFVGMAMLMIGAVLALAKGWNTCRDGACSVCTRYVGWIIVVVLAVVFTMASVAKIQFGKLMPALRNWLFVPHLIIYMVAYAIVAIVFILSLVNIKNEKSNDIGLLPLQGDSRGCATQGVALGYEQIALSGRKQCEQRVVGTMSNLLYQLMNTASQLLVIGMLFGAIWARMAWGDYWTWDAKECWAAVTWLLSLGYLHIKSRKWKVVLVVLTFAALQVTWYGVNYLPASMGSMHTYNN